MMTLETVVSRRVEGVMSADLADEIVMMDLDSGDYHGLNEVGTRIWALVSEPRCVRDVVHELCAEYEVDPDQCHAELLAFLERLHALRLITLHDTEPSTPEGR